MAGSVPDTMAMGRTAAPVQYLLSGVRTRRIFAYLIDIALVFLIQALGFFVMFLLAIPTFGLIAFAFPALAATPLIATLYSGLTLGGPRQSTLGQRAMGLVMVRHDGQPVDFLFGACHALLFYVSITLLSPLVLIVSLIDGQKRLLHDIVLGMTLRRMAG